MKAKMLLVVAVITTVACVAIAQRGWTRSNESHVGQKIGKLEVEKYLGDAPDMKNKVVMVEFWATWCPPCRQSIPHLNELYDKFKGKGFVAIGVSDESEETVKSFLGKTPIKYSVALDKKLSQTFKVGGIPHAMIINRKGVIVWENHPMSLKEQDLEKILAEK